MFQASRLFASSRAKAIAAINGNLNISVPVKNRSSLLDSSRTDSFLSNPESKALHVPNNASNNLVLQKYTEKIKHRSLIFIYATVFTLCYGFFQALIQFADAMSPVNANLIPWLLSKMSPSQLLKFWSTLSSWDYLPIDFWSEDPYLVQDIRLNGAPRSLLYPLGLGAGCDISGSGVGSFIKMGFGVIEVGPIDLSGDPHQVLPEPNFKVEFDDLVKHGLVGVRLLVNKLFPIENLAEMALRHSTLYDYMTIEFPSSLTLPEIQCFESLLENSTEKGTPPNIILFFKNPPSNEILQHIKSSNFIAGIAMDFDETTLACLGRASMILKDAGKLITVTDVKDRDDFISSIEYGANLVLLNPYLPSAQIPRKFKSYLSEKLVNSGYRNIREFIGNKAMEADSTPKHVLEHQKKLKKF
jgi:hypothetical protein